MSNLKLAAEFNNISSEILEVGSEEGSVRSLIPTFVKVEKLFPIDSRLKACSRIDFGI